MISKIIYYIPSDATILDATKKYQTQTNTSALNKKGGCERMKLIEIIGLGVFSLIMVLLILAGVYYENPAFLLTAIVLPILIVLSKGVLDECIEDLIESEKN